MAINVPSVVAGAPIEADWGNTVDLAITELQTDKIGVTGGTMTGPLIVGPAYVFQRLDGVPEARFAHKDAPGLATGYVANSVGDLSAILSHNRNFYFWNDNAAGGHTHRGTIGPGGLYIPTGGVFGDTVNINAASGMCLVLGSIQTAKPYISYWHGNDRYGYLQIDGTLGIMNIATDPNWAIRFLPGNVERMRVEQAGISFYEKAIAYHSPIDGNWWTANYIASNSGSHGARIGFSHPGIAAQIRYGPSGDIIEFINGGSTGHIRIMCHSVIQTSSLDTKKDVRPLRESGEQSRVAAFADSAQLSPESDTVDTPDVMSLRPIIYRSKVEPTKFVLDKEGESTHETTPWPPTEVFGREARREQLGLIADEVQNVLPSAVTHGPDGKPLGIDYSQVTVALLDHVQQLTARVDDLTARLDAVETPA